MKVPVDEAVETYIWSSCVFFGSVKSKAARGKQESENGVEQAAPCITYPRNHLARTKKLPAWQTTTPASVLNN
jgi:hypothetical protein